MEEALQGSILKLMDQDQLAGTENMRGMLPTGHQALAAFRNDLERYGLLMALSILEVAEKKIVIPERSTAKKELIFKAM